MVVKAVYRNGVFKPIKPVDLPEGEWVELEIVRSSAERRPNIVSLGAIWKECVRPEDQGDWVSETLAKMRRDSADKLGRLARALSENLTRE